MTPAERRAVERVRVGSERGGDMTVQQIWTSYARTIDLLVAHERAAFDEAIAAITHDQGLDENLDQIEGRGRAIDALFGLMDGHRPWGARPKWRPSKRGSPAPDSDHGQHLYRDAFTVSAP